MAKLAPDTDLARYQPPADSPIRVTECGSSLAIESPALRVSGTTLGAVGFLAIWCGVVGLTAQLGTPAGFTIIFGLIAILVLLLVLYGLLLRQTVQVEPGRLRLTSDLAGLARISDRTLERNEVNKVAATPAGQPGSGAHQVTVTGPDGVVRVGLSGITERREAEWLVRRIESAMEASV
jgi:hypothetical protein